MRFRLVLSSCVLAASACTCFQGAGTWPGGPLCKPTDSGRPAPVRVGFSPLPSHGGTVTNPWSNGEPRIIKDRTPGRAGELFGFGWSDRLYLFKSANLGDSWTFVDPVGGEVIGTLDVLCAAQDSSGKVHLLFKNGPLGEVEYARVALAYSDGSVTGFSPEVQGVGIPGGYNTNGDIRAILQVVTDPAGAETLVYQVSDNSAPSTFRVQMGKATSLTPAGTPDFVALDGQPGTTLVAADSTFNNHDHSAFFAQLGATRDLWVFFGPVNAEYGAQDSTFITRLRLTATAPRSWIAGAPVQMVGSDAISSPEALAVQGTQRYVWFLYFDPADGLSIDRVDASGTYTHLAVPSPERDRNRNGWGVLSVADDETRLWLSWNSLSRQGPGVSDRTAQAFWNGACWTVHQDPVAGDSWGMGGTLYWNEGLVSTRLHDPTKAISLSTIRGGEASVSSASPGEAGPKEESSMNVTAIPLLSCQALDDVLPFYTALGFNVTLRQERPNPYAATKWQGADVHFNGIHAHDPARGGICLLIVPEVERLHARFCDALRKQLGKVPNAGVPRITRLRPGQTRFTVVDPAGNSIIYIRRDEKDPHEETKRLTPSLSPLGKAMRAAEVLRDFKTDEAAAAKVLKAAISKAKDADRDELARAKAMLEDLGVR